jgi:hypothetical protein
MCIITPLPTHVIEFTITLPLLIADHLLFNLITSVHTLLLFWNNTVPLSSFQITQEDFHFQYST